MPTLNTKLFIMRLYNQLSHHPLIGQSLPAQVRYFKIWKQSWSLVSSQTTWVASWPKVSGELLPHDAKNILPTPSSRRRSQTLVFCMKSHTRSCSGSERREMGNWSNMDITPEDTGILSETSHKHTHDKRYETFMSRLQRPKLSQLSVL